MQRLLQHANRLFERIAAAGASLSMAVLFLIVFINSIRRYTLGKSLEWGEELPVFVAIYGVMFGMAWAYLQDRHIRFTMLVGFLPDSWTRKLYALVDLIVLLSGGLLAYSGWMFASRRGVLEASGIINLAKQLRDLTGWETLIWIGHQYPYQFSMVMGGVMLSVAAALRLGTRLGPQTPAPPAEGE